MSSRGWVLLAVVVGILLATGVVLGTNVVSLDGDGLAAGAELIGPTDPLSSDTDGDGLPDGEERHGPTDATDADTDGDGLEDGHEVTRYGTDPTRADTDGDGLDDGQEVEGETDPLEADTDGDTLEDGREVNELGTDPLSADTDGDGLRDDNEVEAHGTDPTRADTDGDGIDDPDELAGETDPTRADTDGDGLDDGRELDDLGTDPTDADTDGDGLEDGWEVAGRTDDGVALPDADPLRMDLYVQLDYGRPAGPEDGVAGRVEREFAEMPVENPDGSTGITAHVVRGGQTDGEVAYRGSNFDSLETEYKAAMLGDRLGIYRQVLILEFEGVDHTGRAWTPGDFAIVDAESERYHVIVHELLHNVVGELDVPEACPEDSGHHCTDGWLQPTTRPGEDDFLLPSVADQIESDGFER